MFVICVMLLNKTIQKFTLVGFESSESLDMHGHISSQVILTSRGRSPMIRARALPPNYELPILAQKSRLATQNEDIARLLFILRLRALATLLLVAYLLFLNILREAAQWIIRSPRVL